MSQKGCSIFFFLLLAYSLGAKEYVVRYQSLTSGTLFHIDSKEGERVGKVMRQRKGAINYTFLATDETLLATALTEIHLTDTIVRLTDPSGQPVGSFLAEIQNVYPTQYLVFSKEGHLIAKGYMNWLGNSFVLADPDNPRRFLASFFRPMFKLFNDNWHFDIHDEKSIDFRLLSVIGAFQTACDLNFEMFDVHIVD